MCYMITRNTQGRKLCTGVKCAPQYPIVRAAAAQKGYEEANAPSMFCPPTLDAQCVVFDAATSNLFICLPHKCRLLVCKVGSGRKMGRKTWELGSPMPMSALITRRIDRAPIALVGVHRILQLAFRKSKPLFPWTQNTKLTTSIESCENVHNSHDRVCSENVAQHINNYLSVH